MTYNKWSAERLVERYSELDVDLKDVGEKYNTCDENQFTEIEGELWKTKEMLGEEIFHMYAEQGHILNLLKRMKLTEELQKYLLDNNINLKDVIMNTEDFMKWVGEQDPDEQYNYYDNHGCAVYQYLKAKNVNVRYVTGSSYTLSNGDVVRFSLELTHAIAGPLTTKIETFGLLYDRLKTYHKETVK